MLQALAIFDQLREVALITGGYLHLVLLRAHCCCCELRAAGRTYSYLLLVQNQSDTCRRTYNIMIPPAAPFSLAIQASGNKTFIKVKPHTCDTNGHVPMVVLVRLKKKHEIPPHPKHPRLKKHFFSSRKHMYLLAATINAKCDISGMPSMQPTEQICTSPPGLRVSEHMPLYPSCVCLPECSVSRAMPTGVLDD